MIESVFYIEIFLDGIHLFICSFNIQDIDWRLTTSLDISFYSKRSVDRNHDQLIILEVKGTLVKVVDYFWLCGCRASSDGRAPLDLVYLLNSHLLASRAIPRDLASAGILNHYGTGGKGA